jgi:hypothetical protein
VRVAQDHGQRCHHPATGRALAGLEIEEGHDLATVHGLAERFEGRLPRSKGGRVADHRVGRLDAEGVQLGERTPRLGREGSLPPDRRGEFEQHDLVRREGDVGRQVVETLGDAVAQVVVAAGVVGRFQGFQRDAQFPDVVFVALELALEARVVPTDLVALAVALHRREDVALGQADLRRDEREDQAEEAFLDSDGMLVFWGRRHVRDPIGSWVPEGRSGRRREGTTRKGRGGG